MNELTICRATGDMSVLLPAGQELPDSIQWMPPGRHSVRPSVNGEPRRMIMNITSAMADKFNGQLQKIRQMAQAGIADEPYIDFNHEDRERAAEVTELYWGGDDPKTGGIRARIKWSAAGKEAVLGRNYRRFSPSWDVNPDTNEPIGILTNLGGLVNRAAFQTIAPVIAGAATTTKTTGHKMEIKDIEDALDKRFKPLETRLAALEVKPAGATAAAATTAAPDNTAMARAIETAVTAAIKPFSDKLTTMETNTQKAQARAAVQPHINRGAIPPADNDGIAFWENSWIANAKQAEAAMAKMPGVSRTRLITDTRANPAEVGATGEPEDQIVTKANELMKANAKLTTADAMIAAARGSNELYKGFRAKFASNTAAAKN